ncbi:MAG: hypothetical protein M1823_002288 [Watsoniomyces obsoletus]|nr:MAG: hypothetical protein M1823_002288 [Watsoniomyces obsoletus]
MALPTQFAYRTLKGIGVINADPVYEPLSGLGKPEGTFRCSAYSPCGRYYAWASHEAVTVIDASTGSALTTLPAPAVYELAFSPRGSFVITWERPSKDEEGNATKNLKVWRVIEEKSDDADKTPMGSFVQRSQSGWNLQYTGDEQYCARAVTNEVHFYQSDNLREVSSKLRAEGLTEFALSGGEKQSLAVFIPERKGQPAAVKVFNVPNFATVVSQKSFYKADKVQLKWNQLGTSLIVLAQTEVDKTGKSYYGETNLYLLSASGDFDSRLQLDKEGPIHDVTWSPNSKHFGVVYGYMPAKTTIFNTRAVATHSFPLAPRNTILFSPHGRFVLVAGFGNLAGQIDIYDGNKDYHKVTTIESGNPSVCEWSPDGVCILTATTSPRLRVDNGVRIWHVSGGLIYNEDLTELYEVTWRPASPDQYPLKDPFKAPTPHSSALAYLGRVKTPSKPAGAYRPPGARGQTTPLHFKREDEGGAAHISNGLSSSSYPVSEFGKPRRREVPGAEAAASSSSSSSPLPPGAAPGGGVSLTGVIDPDEGLSKTAMKNRKKREAKKAKEAIEKDHGNHEKNEAHPTHGGGIEHQDQVSKNHPGGSEQGGARPSRREKGDKESGKGGEMHHHHHVPPGSKRSNKNNKSNNNDRKDVSINDEGNEDDANMNGPSGGGGEEEGEAGEAGGGGAGEAGGNPSLGGSSGGSPEQKKVRSLLKKLRAIDDLKMRLAGGEKLEDTQMKKIHSEEGVRKELESIGWTG